MVVIIKKMGILGNEHEVTLYLGAVSVFGKRFVGGNWYKAIAGSAHQCGLVPDQVAEGSALKKIHQTTFIDGVYFYSRDKCNGKYMTIEEYVSRDRPFEI